MAPAILGKKLGMTQIFDAEGRIIPVTLIQAGPCQVLQVRTTETDGYEAVQMGFDPARKSRISRPQAGHVKKAGARAMRFVREVRTNGDGEKPEAGAMVTVDCFEGVALVDVTGTSKGKGFQGVMKRWGFKGLLASHGTERKHRSGGSIGSGSLPDKAILPGKKMAGHMGHVRRTVQRLAVVRIDADRNLLVVKGSVPGPNGGYLMIRRSVKS
ncbi:MAG: 50S ribosomal protein L3 [Anaerolineaceae bacterium]|nr:50S ribosomal protein L3 [Anaerolineaceae bacterium]